jgi:hypothetical protein
MKNTESEATQRAGASPHPPLDTLSRARGPPTRHSARLTRARGPSTRRTTPRSGLVPRIDVEVARRGAPSPGNQTKPPDCRCGSNHHVAFPRTKSPPSSQKIEEVARAVFRRCTAPGEFSRAESPAAIHCRPSHHRLSLPQASSINVVPHRTGDCQATLDAAERCKQMNDSRVKTSGLRPPT